MPMPSPSIRRAGACLALLCLASSMASAGPALATIENKTTATACAEEDNVSLTLSGSDIARFRVEALQPAYLASVAADTTAPDFSGCNFDGGTHPTDPRYSFKPNRQVLHEDGQWRIVGMVLPSFWRPNQVPVTVGRRTVTGIHLLQIFRKAEGGKAMEALVLYPADGYWRIKPLPEARFGDGAYGSSFLMGPVEPGARPVVNIASVTVRPQPLSIRLRFANGTRAAVDVAEVSRTRTALDVSFRPAASSHGPFAVLRSMYVAPDNADMSDATWQTTPQSAPVTTPLAEVGTIRASEVRFGRTRPSRHNTSAPDIAFSRFENARAQ
jgi:hypothetical protein